jgi:cyclopropane fatty-acyl-phospholipid synthase-like methyltransferase
MEGQSREYTSEEYDRLFAEGGYEGTYHLPYRRSAYYPLFRRVLNEVQCRHGHQVLEVGCGTGAFAHMLLERTGLTYRGFDFSAVAVAAAKRRTGRSDAFFVADATHVESYSVEYDTIVCTEVLEHVQHDLDVVNNWRTGALCVCSVPNFGAENHVRFFRKTEEVRTRYGKLIDVDTIVRIKKPELSDISLRSYMRALRWNRSRPRRLASILGLTSFDNAGGWFLVIGRRK